MTPSGIKECKGNQIVAKPKPKIRGECPNPRAADVLLEIVRKIADDEDDEDVVELAELGEDEWVDESKLFFVESSGKTLGKLDSNSHHYSRVWRNFFLQGDRSLKHANCARWSPQ